MRVVYAGIAVIGFTLLWMVGGILLRALHSGELELRYGGRVQRADHPVNFWVGVLIYVAIAALNALLFQGGIASLIMRWHEG